MNWGSACRIHLRTVLGTLLPAHSGKAPSLSRHWPPLRNGISHLAWPCVDGVWRPRTPRPSEKYSCPYRRDAMWRGCIGRKIRRCWGWRRETHATHEWSTTHLFAAMHPRTWAPHQTSTHANSSENCHAYSRLESTEHV